MSLTLPSDLEPFVDSIDEIHREGAYALVLERPDDFGSAWDDRHDRRPGWFDAARTADTLCYVGGASDVLARLEDHRDGDVRTTVLTEVCDFDRLHTVWWADDDPYVVVEFRLAKMLMNERPRWYVRQQ